MPPPFPAQFSMDPGGAVDSAVCREDPADMPAQLGVRFGPVLDGGDRAQPGVEAGDTHADDTAQHGHGVMAPLGRDEGVFRRHAAPLAKTAAALRRIRFSSSSRFTSRLRRSISASFAFFLASASAEPAASASLRWLSWPGLTSSSAAMSASGLPLPITR